MGKYKVGDYVKLSDHVPKDDSYSDITIMEIAWINQSCLDFHSSDGFVMSVSSIDRLANYFEIDTFNNKRQKNTDKASVINTGDYVRLLKNYQGVPKDSILCISSFVIGSLYKVIDSNHNCIGLGVYLKDSTDSTGFKQEAVHLGSILPEGETVYTCTNYPKESLDENLFEQLE